MEKPFKIGVWVNEIDLAENGGAFSYTESLIEAVDNKDFSNKLDIVFVGYNLKQNFNKKVISLSNKENYYKRKIINFFHKIFSISINNNNIEKIKQQNIKQLNDEGVELIFYPNPFVQLLDFPYICVCWDLGHKSTYSFPELATNKEYEHRDFQSNLVLNKALFICSESETGKNELVKYYNINEKRIRVLPIFPGKIVNENIRNEQPKWMVEDQIFFLYPAQFWPHKNHYNLLVAFNKFIVKHPNAKLVLTGSDKGNLPYIKNVINNFELNEYVIIPGFIKNETLKWLYLNTKGLVFPSFLGPTNMPLLEALYLGCNIACSNLAGHKELLKDNAIYFDPCSPNSIFECLEQLMKIPKENNGKLFDINEVTKNLEKILEESILIRRTWAINYKPVN